MAKDECLAFVYNNKAAHQGDSLCQENIAKMYQLGLGCEQSYERAAEWYEKAALTSVFMYKRNNTYNTLPTRNVQ